MLEDIKSLQSEIRKLWDLSNKRNKVDIAKQEQLIQKLQTELKSTSTLLATVKTQSAGTNDQITAAKKALQEVKDSNSTLSKSLEGSLAAQKKELASLKSQIGDASDYEDRITSLEIAIKAIDAHRSQVNGRLERIDREIGLLQQKPAGG
jgi:chromosome segregation ATPase